MRYGVVIHGPEVIDSGEVKAVLDWLGERGEVEATLGGAMGLAALLDAGLEERVSVVPRQLVSRAIMAMDGRADVVILLNRAKSRESGLAFGRLVVSRVIDGLRRPLVQIDDGFAVVWKDGALGPLPDLIKERCSEVLPAPTAPAEAAGRRTLHGVRPGENIWINGTVIGKATSSSVAIWLDGGELRFENVEPKPHGLEKVKVGDLQRAIIRSGSVRRTRAAARPSASPQGNRVILVDHRAEDSIFRAKGAAAAVTVGDDTTCISTSLLARLGVPVVGIIDGDEDGLCLDREAAPGSVQLLLRPGNDDQLGERVRGELFGGEDEMRWSGGLHGLIASITAMAGDKLLEIRKR